MYFTPVARQGTGSDITHKGEEGDEGLQIRGRPQSGLLLTPSIISVNTRNDLSDSVISFRSLTFLFCVSVFVSSRDKSVAR